MINSDNSKCKKPLLPVVVKLKMEIYLEGKMRGWDSYSKKKISKTLFEHTGLGCAAHSQTEQVIGFTIPTSIEKSYTPWACYMPSVCGKTITASEKEMLSQLPVTYHGKNLKVEYMVKVIQKNDALNDLTESGSAFYIAINVNQHNPKAV